jgi:hypothetical protein
VICILAKVIIEVLMVLYIRDSLPLIFNYRLDKDQEVGTKQIILRIQLIIHRKTLESTQNITKISILHMLI